MGKEGKVKKSKEPKTPKEAKAAPDTPAAAEEGAAPQRSYEEQTKFVSVIAKPLADEKLCKKTLKLAKKAAKRKQIKRGVKEVVKSIKKGSVKGICILAGDISPIDVITHIPIVCEEAGIPYTYVPSKEELGAAALSKRPTSCMLILPRPIKGAVDDAEQKEFEESFSEVEKKVKAAQLVV